MPGHCRVFMPWIAIMGLLCLPFAHVSAQAVQGAKTEVKPMHDGQHDFDSHIGKWKTHLKRLVHPELFMAQRRRLLPSTSLAFHRETAAPIGNTIRARTREPCTSQSLPGDSRSSELNIIVITVAIPAKVANTASAAMRIRRCARASVPRP